MSLEVSARLHPVFIFLDFVTFFCIARSRALSPTPNLGGGPVIHNVSGQCPFSVQVKVQYITERVRRWEVKRKIEIGRAELEFYLN
jgi:hypothetical protein